MVVPLLAAILPIFNSTRITIREALTSYGIGTNAKPKDRNVSKGALLIPRPMRLSLRNVFRRKIRLALTLIAISLGGSIFIGVYNIQASFNKLLDDLQGYFLADVNIYFTRYHRYEEVSVIAMSNPGVSGAEGRLESPGTFITNKDEEGTDFTFVGLPPTSILIDPADWALLTINGTGWISFRADDRDIGVHLVNVTVRDRANLTATVSFTVTVRPVNEAPANALIKLPANGTKFRQAALVSFEGEASDVHGDLLNYTWYSGGEVIGYGKSLSTKALKPGKHLITLTVSDGNLSAASSPVQIEITKKPAAAGKGFLPGFEMVAVGAAGLLAAMVVLGRRPP